MGGNLLVDFVNMLFLVLMVILIRSSSSSHDHLFIDMKSCNAITCSESAFE